MSQDYYKIKKTDENIDISCQKYSDGSTYIDRLGYYADIDTDKLISAIAFVKDCSDNDFSSEDLWKIFFKVLDENYDTYDYSD